MSAPAPKSPSDDKLLQAVSEIRGQRPDLGRAKLLVLLRQQYHFTISEARPKKLVPAANSTSNEPLDSIAQRLGIPKNALAAQTRYRDTSTRIFRVYGRGEYDYGVSLNADMATFFNIYYNRMQKAPRPKTEQSQRSYAAVPVLQTIWDYYVAVANKVKMTKPEIGAQFELEYGVPWTMMPKAKPEWTGSEAVALKAKFKERSLKVKKELLKNPEARPYIPTDEKGEPIWNEEKYGQFAVLVVKIDKQDGLTEFGEI